MARKNPNGAKLAWLNEIALGFEGDDCLLFPFPVSSSGYGAFRLASGTDISAHVYVCEAANGPRPSSDHEVAHKCNPPNRRCVNKRHLRWSTRKDNLADQLVHGTRQRGAKHPGSKLSEEDVLKIKSASGSQRAIARQFGISQAAVSDIKCGRRWAWLGEVADG